MTSGITCRAAVPPHAEGGVWRVSNLYVVDRGQNGRSLFGTVALPWAIPTSTRMKTWSPETAFVAIASE